MNETGPDGAVAKSSANGPSSKPEQVFSGPMGQGKATAPSSLSLTTYYTLFSLINNLLHPLLSH